MDPALAMLIVLIVMVVGAMALGRRMLVSYYGRYECTRHARALVSDVDFAPGDIILFNSSAHGFTNSAITADFFSHAGMVVQDPATGGLYVSDSSGGGVFPAPDGAEYVAPAGSMRVPLYTRLKHYAGEAYHVRLDPPLPPEKAARLWDLTGAYVPYTGMAESLVRILGLPWFGRKSRHCMAHVAWLVDSLGLTPQDLQASGRALEDSGFIGVCSQVTGLPGRRLGARGDAAYAPPVHILYDLDAQKPAPAAPPAQKPAPPA